MVRKLGFRWGITSQSILPGNKQVATKRKGKRKAALRRSKKSAK